MGESKNNQVPIELGNIEVLKIKLLNDISKKLDKLIELKKRK